MKEIIMISFIVFQLLQLDKNNLANDSTEDIIFQVATIS